MLNFTIMRLFCLFLVFTLTFFVLIRGSSVINPSDTLNLSVLNQREVQITGNRILSNKQIRAYLPETNNLSWFFYGDEVESELRRHPLINNVQLTSCSAFKINCFQVEVHEAKPAFILKVQDQSDQEWLVSKEAEYLVPYMPQHEDISIRYPRIVVDGSSERPESFRSKILYLINLTERINEHQTEQVEYLRFNDHGEVHIQFKGRPWLAQFSNFEEQGYHRLGLELERLQKMDELLLAQKGIFSIDLTYEKVAVLEDLDDFALVPEKIEVKV